MRTQLLFEIGVLIVMLTPLAMSQEKVVMEWRFDKEGDFKGWSPGGHVAEASVIGGALRGQAIGHDPILLGPVIEVKASPTQRVEIKMKATQDARAELFWTNTLEGKYGGFGSEKRNDFDIRGDNQFHVYRIYPLWHAVGKIIRLRVDPPNQGRFEIEWIRIVEDTLATASEAKSWRFDTDAKGWRAWQDASDPVVKDGCLEVTATGKEPIIMSPLLSVPADENPFVSIRMATRSGTMGRVFGVSSSRIGWTDAAFKLHADGKMHSYNVDVGSLNQWQDKIIMLGVQPADAESSVVRIDSIEIAPEPRGPAEIEVGYLGASQAINRVGRPVEVACSIRNLGGEAAQNVAATLTVPTGVRIIGEAKKTVDEITLYLGKSVTWQIECDKPGLVDLSARIEAPGAEAVSCAARIKFTQAPDVPKASYVPEPEPVKSKYELGAYYFPGWYSIARWQPIFDYPERKPVLGWYDEGNPECADWQIKWAVEHGINFFMLDWYWCRGARHLEHWLHDAYMKAKYRKYLKWAVMWANHNPPNTHSLEDWRNVTQYWIDNYFGMEEYYRIDDRPAVFIWAPRNVRRDVGGSEEAAKLYALSQQMAREAGYKGIYFLAMSSHETEAECKELKSEGYEGFTSYHAFQIAMGRGGGRYCSFADVVETSPEVWKMRDENASGLLHIPIADTGWSPEPWHHSEARVVSGRTPELFGKLCRSAKEYADRTDKKIIAIGPWNEWGEGSYIEPYAQYGFQDLDRLRSAFCEPGDYPPNLIPSDVGLGPYDLKPVEEKTAWEFNTEGDSEGWMASGLVKMEIKDGLLSGESVGRNPILNGPGIQIEAARYKRLSVRMSSSAADRAQLYWGTTLSRQSETNSVRFDLVGDGQFHDYNVDLGQRRQWRGVIVSLRFDPVNQSGVKFAIDCIRLLKE